MYKVYIILLKLYQNNQSPCSHIILWHNSQLKTLTFEKQIIILIPDNKYIRNLRTLNTRLYIHKQKQDKKNPLKPYVLEDSSVGVTRFELAASASLRRRSNQTEPHPDLP